MAESKTKPKQDNLHKAVGISRENANKMDFFHLMKNLPQDIKRNVGGQVKAMNLAGYMGGKLDREWMENTAHDAYEEGAGIWGWAGMYHHISDRDAKYHEKHLGYGGDDPRMDRIEERIMKKEDIKKHKYVKRRIEQWLGGHGKTRFANQKQAENTFYNSLN